MLLNFSDFNKNFIPKYVAVVLLILIVISPLAGRGVMSLKTIPQATTNIYEQQYQMGWFYSYMVVLENCMVE